MTTKPQSSDLILARLTLLRGSSRTLHQKGKKGEPTPPKKAASAQLTYRNRQMQRYLPGLLARSRAENFQEQGE